MRASRLAIPLLAAVTALGLATPANAAGPGPAYIEPGGGQVVTAAPPVSRPSSAHCTVTLASHFRSNASDGSPQNYSGTLTPPSACRGPWAKVILDSTTSVSGRQYDRSGSLQIGGATVWFGTTQEPSGAEPTTFSFSKDITEFSALLASPQPYNGGIGNYTSSVYTGVYDQTVTITYYVADRNNPAPTVPDKVIGVPVPDLNPGASSATVTLPTLPTNITGARLQTTLKGNGCDEQWFTAVPDQVAADFPGDGLCAAGAYREALVSVDDQRAGAVGTYPHIYSGGIVPTLWRPVLAIDTLDLRPENLDLTPFAGRLVDGGTHTMTFTINPINDTWNVSAVLFLYTDHHRAHTTGRLLTDAVAAAPTTKLTTGAIENGSVSYGETARRSDRLVGYVDTSAGRVVTTVDTGRSWSNTGSVGDAGLVQKITQSDALSSSSVSKVGRRVVASATLSENYPLTVDFSAADYTDDQNFSLAGTVTMGQRVASVVLDGHQPTFRGWDWTVDSYGILARTNGVTSESDGHSSTSYVGTTDAGRPYRHRITTDHGQVTSDRS